MSGAGGFAPTAAWVFVYGLASAVATGLGALPLVFVRTITPRVAALSQAVASGLMLGASFGLIVEGTARAALPTVAGAGIGLLFIVAADRLLAGRPVHLGDLRGSGARRALLVLVIMTVHSFAEGVAVGVAFGGGEALARLITLAIAMHNIPEGLAISAVLRPRGAALSACAGWSIVSSLPQPLMAVPAFLFVDAFAVLLPYGLGFAAGAMVYMVFVELLPEAYAGASVTGVGLATSLSFGLMVLFQHWL